MIVACVRTGTRYGADWVYKLRDGVARHLSVPHRFVCLTDRPEELPGIETSGVGKGLDGWWRKMALFEPMWRAGEKVLYFDLDTVICGTLDHLASLDIDFGICENFAHLAGQLTWPCSYSSSVMVIGQLLNGSVWQRFTKFEAAYIRANRRYGDQKVIEELLPEATVLQSLLYPKFFVHYRGLTNEKPEGCSVVVFGGACKPDNCSVRWVREAWT